MFFIVLAKKFFSNNILIIPVVIGSVLFVIIYNFILFIAEILSKLYNVLYIVLVTHNVYYD